MQAIRKHEQFAISDEYGAQLKRIYPAPPLQTPFGSACVTVKAGTASKPHRHHEHETFIILQGAGTFVQDDVRSDISTGDVVYIIPLSEHAIEADAGGDVQFISIWWDDKVEPVTDDSTRYVVFTPPPTPNGDLHLGHIAGPYISADIIRRHLRSQGKIAHLIVGTDKSQSYVDLKARQRDVSAQNVYQRYTQSIMQTFERAGIEYDAVHDCDSEFHVAFVHDFIRLLLDKGILRIHLNGSAYCDNCRVEVFDAFAKGSCPSCGASSNGCVCEDCGSPNNSYDLGNLCCNLCGAVPVSRQFPKGVLDLERCRGLFAEAAFQINMPPKLATYLQVQDARPMDDYVVTFQGDWGIASQYPMLAGQTYLAWIEMAAGYVAALYKAVFNEETSNVEQAIERLNKADFEVIHLMGFDNSFYYAYLYPRILAAIGLRGLKITFAVNEFLLLEQLKFSTSRGHAIWANDVFTSAQITDWYRFFLSLKRPEASRENYQSDEFERFRLECSERLSTLSSCHQTRLDRFSGGVAPVEAGSWNRLQIEYAAFFARHEQHLLNTLSAPNSYTVKQYANAVQQLIDSISHFQRLTSAHYLDGAAPDERRTSLFIEAGAVVKLHEHLACLMPNVTRELLG
ncbi:MULTISPECIES: class I tRNA ligase family protein [unclassified Paraburkholderia]|uniref:class I tRNA ligase family protein n=1 Tax=unclassified Paraburkholderia TaxID=2615204 RepID=UPI00162078C1|nr:MULTISPECIES: class I tRNA ligase family protein [unclassified Paraburkholderia]MBB5448367.1 methionyl-tRNA synthetase [Paraburkholderia sp. WSM4177]MBB5488748.1 methionyl-tRNA synthetase [Paraburkholderia sp. WSM4180]